MTAAPISESLRRFILAAVPSVPFMEALLIAREAAPSPVTVELVAARLYVDARRAADLLEQLGAAGVVERDREAGGYRYSPGDDLRPMVDELAQVYRTNLVEVAGLIHSSTGRMAQRFSDAFKWRKD